MWRIIDAIPLWFRRIFTIAILLAVFGFIGLGIVAWFVKPQAPPTTKEAPWAVQTSSRIYYAKSFSSVDGSPAIKDYWSLDGKRYSYHQDILVFDKTLYGNVDIVRRPEK